MPFWTYMLHCRGGYFYVGHTDDLERRVGDHKSGLIPGFTADHQPVELVWSDEFPTRDQARDVERKLIGLSRAKKMALIRGDWERISALAKKKDSASTNSAWTGEGARLVSKPTCPEPIEGSFFSLQPHPDTAPFQVRSITAKIWMTDINDLLVEFGVEGSQTLLIPPWAASARKDGLWETTCFEVFLKCDDGRYFEFNLSPSTEWAVYAFDSYRSGMRPLDIDVPPHIEFAASADRCAIEADVDLGQIPFENLELSLSAVIEETDGTMSFWALNHPSGKPDFHHPACFMLKLPTRPA